MKSCPIAHIKVDENSVRVLASLVSALCCLFIFYPQFSLLLILLYDYLVRSIGNYKLSPLFHASKFFAKLMRLKKNEVDAGPKLFASKIGFLFVLSAIILLLLQYAFIATVVIVILLVCAMLEAVFGYCIGCQIYMILKKFGF